MCAGALPQLARLDALLGALDDAGALVAVTGDVTYSVKADAEDAPAVVYLEEELAAAGLPDMPVRSLSPSLSLTRAR